MDAIISRVGMTDAQLRGHCTDAVLDELKTTDTQLQTAIGALNRSLEVVEASKELLKGPPSLIESSTHVSERLSSVVKRCIEIAPLGRKLRRVTSSSRALVANGYESSSSTEEENDIPFFSVKEEPGAAVADGAQSDTEQESIVEETVKLERHSAEDEQELRPPQQPHDLRSTAAAASTPRRNPRTHDETPRRSSGRKRKAPDRYLTPLPLFEKKKVSKRELLEDRLALHRQGKLSKMMRACLLAVQDGDTPVMVQKLKTTCRALARMKDGGDDITPFMEDIEAALGVALSAIDKYEGNLVRKDLRTIQLLLESFPKEFHDTGKLKKLIAAKFVTPLDEVEVIRARLEKILKEVREWCAGTAIYSVSMFEDRLTFVKETLGASAYEGGYDPHWDKTVSETLFRLGCCLNVFETGWAQDRRYDTIRSLLFHMKSADRSKR